MLTLPIKKKWFDMILSGEKKEEYREIKPYYISRFSNMFKLPKSSATDLIIDVLEVCGEIYLGKIIFRNGYSKNSPSFIAECTLSAGTGKEEWGAEKDKQYFVLKVHEILERKEKDVCSE